MQLPKCLNPTLEDSRWSAPVDIRDLAIRLETEGVSNSVASSSFGFENTWAMAESWFPKLATHDAAKKRPDTAVAHSRRRYPWVEYLTGTSFALPLLFSCIAILLLRFSLWGGELTSSQASAMGLGITCSFIASGGFVQAMSRQGLWYKGTGQFRRCAQSTWDWLRRSLITLIIIAVAGAGISAYFDWLPGPLYSLAAAFYLGLSLLWLCTGVLYMLEKNLMVAVAALLGIASVVLLHRGLKMNLLASQMLSIVLAAVFAIAVAGFLLRNNSREDAGLATREPRARTFYYLWPYFAYGCLYYLFLFSDRLLAWTAHQELSGLSIQFRGSYESGQDVALFAFIFQVGWVHSSTVRFYQRLQARQKELLIDQSWEFNCRMMRSYWRMALSFVPLAVVTTVAVYGTAWSLGFLADPMHGKVMGWSLAGYLLLIVSLRNVSLLFALSSPISVLWAIGCACLANFVTGYLFSRFGSYDQAVIGFTVGSAVFAVLSTWYSLRTLRRLDYYYFASAA